MVNSNIFFNDSNFFFKKNEVKTEKRLHLQIIDQDPEDRVTPARWIRGKKRNAVILC
jgi:hypothetical protein